VQWELTLTLTLTLQGLGFRADPPLSYHPPRRTPCILGFKLRKKIELGIVARLLAIIFDVLEIFEAMRNRKRETASSQASPNKQ